VSIFSGTSYEARWLARDAWWLALVWGVAAVVLGALLLLNPSPTSEFFFIVLAGLFLTAGISELVHVITHVPHLDASNLIRGVFSVAVAALILVHPLGITARVTYFAIAFLGLGKGLSSLLHLYLQHHAGIRLTRVDVLKTLVPALVSIGFGVAVVFLVVDATTLSRTVLITGAAALLGGAVAIFLALRSRKGHHNSDAQGGTHLSAHI
jgi:uncharacterized membrane protein HdeD (DUF308 family)